MSRFLLFAFFLCAMTGCLEREYDLETLRAPQDYSIEEARDVVITYSDSAMLRVKIEGPLLRRYIYRFRVEEEFPESVHVTFYDVLGQPSAWLSAKYAIRKPQDNKTIVRDSVVLYNTAGEKLEGLELVWDENAESIETDKFVRITRPDEVIYSRGFKSNQDFTDYTFYAIEGDMLMKELGPTEDE